jgi:Domain of unknown function (DUF6398)
MEFTMNPIPTTNSAWIDEVRRAFADASTALPFEKLLGNNANPAFFPVLASNLCAKYRGLPFSGHEFDEAAEGTLASYEASAEYHAKSFETPEVAFAFCYVASHYGYGFISETETGRILDYLMDHADLLLTPAKPRPPWRKPRLPAVGDPRLDELLRLTTAFCKAHLNQEYEDLCAKLVHKAGRKRTPPYASGKIESWAAGVVHAICTVNFAFDKSQTPHVTPPCIAEHFGVSMNTASQKSKTLRNLFRLRHWDAEFSTEEMQKRNPMHLLRIW